MAQSFIDKYVFALMLDSSNFEKGANLATKAANGIKSTLLKTYTALGGIDLFKGMMTTYTNASRSIDNFALTTGENIVKLQAWDKSIQDTGGNIETFRNTLGGLSESLAKFKMGFGASDAIKTMFSLGLRPQDAQGNWKKGLDLLLEIGKVLNTFSDEAQAYTLAKAMGIDESTFKLMRRYGDNLDQIIKKNEKWALINKQDIETSRKYDLMISSFKTSWLELSKTIMSAVLPVLQNDIFPEVEKLVTYFSDNKDLVYSFFKNIADGSKAAIPVVETLVKSLGYIPKATEVLATAAAEMTFSQEKNTEKYGKLGGTMKTIGDIYGPTARPFLNTMFPGFGLLEKAVPSIASKVGQAVVNINGDINVNSTREIPSAMENAVKGGTNVVDSLSAQIEGVDSL